jgi:16S rRNA (cytosine967-C5)-methyltransferase
VAVRFLRDLFKHGHHADFLSQDADFLDLDERDRRLVTELVYGVLRNRRLLDHHVGELSRTPLGKLDESVLWVLRSALYEIEFLRIPDHAAVHEAVELCRKFRKASAAGLVNAVLRSFLREKPAVPEGASSRALAVRFSHPEWLVRRYLNRYGAEQTEHLLQRNNEPPTQALWVNVFKTDLQSLCRELESEGISYQVDPRLPNCITVDVSGFTQHRAYKEGLCFFMDRASQEVAYLVEVKNRSRLADFCCAPGGKSFLLASQKEKDAQLYCCDSSFVRLRETQDRSRFLRIPDLSFIQADLRSTPPFRKPFDFVLLDVPCSGLGTLRSNPDIRWKIQENDLFRFRSRQVSLLQSGFSTLVPGGVLTYSTCSTEPEENETVIEEFLAKEPDARLIGDFFRTYPEPHPGDCFFAARIERA